MLFAYLMTCFTVGCNEPVQQPPSFSKETFAIKHIFDKLIELVLHSYRNLVDSIFMCKQSNFGEQWHLL